jgi:predicted TIM-barrel fold metal-dependent hydrolase
MTKSASSTSTLPAPEDIRVGIAVPNDRHAQRVERPVPKDVVIVSADNHWTIGEDIFYENVPKHLQGKVPRILRDEKGFLDWQVDGKSLFTPTIQTVFDSYERLPGASELGPRIADLDAEGIAKEICFPNGLFRFLVWPDLEVRESVFRVYNRYLGDLQRQAPGRFYGVGIPNYWDMSKARDSIQEIKDLGLKTLVIPIFPRDAANPLNYCEPEMEPLFAAIEESELPLCFHVGENTQGGRGGVGVSAMVNFAPFRKSLGELIFGGIFDRQPGLQVAFMEADLNWVPGALQIAEMAYDCHPLDYRPQRRPTEYWQEHCYASFMHDPAGLRLLDLIGADRVMWSHDYPHPESVWGFSWSAMAAVIDAVRPEQVAPILGGTALKLFKLDD